MYTIRQCNDQDFPAIIALFKELAKHIGAEGSVSITVDQLNRDKDHFNCLVAESTNNEVIGIASYFLGYSSWAGKSLFLDDLIVRDSWRGQGVGSALFDELEQMAGSLGCKRIRWEVTKENVRAQEFYRRRSATLDEGMILCKLDIKKD